MKHYVMTVVTVCMALAAPGVASAFDDGGSIIYQPFDAGEPTVSLRQFKGKYVELLLPNDWIYSTSNPAGLTDEERRILIDRADITYQYYKEILQGEPVDPPGRNTIGLLRIAVVDIKNPDVQAWAHFGLKELEIRHSSARLQQFKSEIADGFETNRQIINHEMAHNFDLYDLTGDALYMWYENTCVPVTTTNWCHAWTDFWDGFLPYYGRVAGIRETVPNPMLELTADGQLGWWTGNSYLPYYKNIADPNVDWEECVRDSNCTSPITARDTWAGIMHRYVQLYGVEAMLAAMDYLKDYVAANPAPASKEEKEHLHIAMLAHGAQANLSCFLDEWQWYTSPALAFEMSVYGPPGDNPFCKDLDADGFTPLQGDCNDASNTVAPGMTELNNGIDDDCNGRVDDLLLAEPAGGFDDPEAIVLPQKIQGGISGATDSDTFIFNVSSPLGIDVTLTSPGSFAGAFVVYDGNGAAIFSQHVDAGKSVRVVYELHEARDWTIGVVYDGSAGAYELSVGGQPLLPLNAWAALSPPAKEGLDYRLSTSTLTLAKPIVSETPTHIRFWVTGVGVVGSVPYAGKASVLWRPTINEEAGTYGYRAQLMAGNKPVSDWTPIEWFNYIGPCFADSDCDDGDRCTTAVCNLTYNVCSFDSLDGTYEAETMFHSTGNAYDEGWNVYDQNGYISFVHPTFIGGTQWMTVTAAGENGAGWPNMLVTVGGVPVFSTTVASTEWTDYTFPFPAPVGPAEVRIRFTNDYYQPPVDRNLLIDKATVQCSADAPDPEPINLGPVNTETKFVVSGVQNLVVNALTFGWSPTQIVVGIGHTDNQTLNGISVSVNGGAPIALSGDWQQINIPYTGQSEINLTVYSPIPRALRTQWWAQ